ncbi:2-nitropropane dioxygenase [Cantharellus anzutake]|uniref:2-nitropropane dioxygenase n=1 Tax=Cantharellus anzutake TaxID=1750568 RepID=UPI0019070500|nr:2-nitropropane dioxygenase [Cantharellus anzutake]KAF8315748.1 2-nitropropane dioxygenase [Cantharellus anzutake]
MAPISTEITKLFGIQHPILLAGMNVAAGPELAAAVTNAGGLGVIGGVGYTPKFLRQQIELIKKDLKDPNAPFGVDLLIPQVGEGARKTNYDYTKGSLSELIDVIIEEGAKLFVCAVGVPPVEVVERLHKAGIPVMNMIGHPKHIQKALARGVDIICAQAGEGGGHTGDIPFGILIPACLDELKGKKSPLTGKQVPLIAAGGISDGRGLAAALAYGAQAVWVGTRFVASVEAGAPKAHKEAILSAGYGDAVRTLIFTGRPLRVRRTPYVENWEKNRQEEIKELTSQGEVPFEVDLAKNPKVMSEGRSFLLGEVSAVIKDIKPAKQIVDEMVAEAVEKLRAAGSLLQERSRL